VSEKPAVHDHGKPELAGWCPELTALAGSTGMNAGVRARELPSVNGNPATKRVRLG